jgi:hypothetical protein
MSGQVFKPVRNTFMVVGVVSTPTLGQGRPRVPGCHCERSEESETLSHPRDLF